MTATQTDAIDFASVVETLDTVSKIKCGHGRVTRSINGLRYFVCQRFFYNGTPWDGAYLVSVQRNGEFGYKTVRQYLADALQVRSLYTMRPEWDI